jgi:PKD repeat protein
MKTKLISTLFLCFLMIGTASSQNESSFILKLKSGQYECPANLKQFIQAPFENEEVHQGFYFRVLQFDKLPTDQTRQEMEVNGIELLNYIPNSAYQARISIDANLDKLEYWDVRSVFPLSARMKFSKQLAMEDYPNYALLTSDVLLVNAYYNKGFRGNDIADWVSEDGYKVVKINGPRSMLKIEVPISEIPVLASYHYFNFLECSEAPPQIENERARTNHRNNFYQNGSEITGGYDGSGVVVAVGDGGTVGDHIDFQGRMNQQYNADPVVSTHATHVSGIVMGAGNYDPEGRGNAPGVLVYSYEYGDAIDSSASHYALHNVRITTNSWGYGNNCGNNNYNGNSVFMDASVYDNPSLMHVFSSGNYGTGSCYGAGTGWGNLTAGEKIAKNVITVGNLNESDVLANSSSRGPSDDGRIKPEVCGVGTSVNSTYPDNTYASISGTSMSCPGVTGTLANMYHAYSVNNNGVEPTSALMKALLLNGAEDLGNDGPDFRFGFGRVNARRSLKAIENQTYFEDSVSTTEMDTFALTVPSGLGELRVLLYWNDKEATPFALEPLVNDLKLEVVDPSGMIYDPWVLDPSPNATSLNAPATRGVDSLNNIEQVTIDLPQNGDYTIRVHGASVPFGPQHFIVAYEYRLDDEITVVYPNGGDALVPGASEALRWDAIPNGNDFTLDYSDDNGLTWNAIGTSGANTLRRQWTVPSTLASDQVLIRVSRGFASDESDSTFTVLRTPGNVQVLSVCPDSISFSWNVVTGASSYEILRMSLSDTYMEVVGTATGTSGSVFNHNPSEDYYYTIRAVGSSGGLGQRRDAFFVPSGLTNCVINDDVVIEVLSPFEGPQPGCAGVGSSDVVVRLTNQGTNDVNGFSASYVHDGGAPVTQSWTDTLSSGSSMEFTFTQSLTPNMAGTNNLGVYHSILSDQNKYNDTAKVSFYLLAGGTVSMTPWMDNLESFTACNTSSDCGATVCPLPGGWLNLANGIDDDIDWRTNFGDTPSNNTGPSQDYNPGTSNGKYVYLEASNGCTGQEAIMYSPCIAIPSTGAFELTYRYHMNGTAVGELHTDLIVNERLIEDVLPALSGDQGSAWNLASLSLAPYLGDTVVVRLRGTTGPDWSSDIALDDFKIEAPSNAPSAGFDASTFEGCPGQVVDFINTSTGAPTVFAWYVSPATGWSYVNGTSATSTNVSIQFTAAGSYTVGMTADNGVGVDSVGIAQPVFIGSTLLPFFEDFELATGFDRFRVTNPDGDITWERQSASGNGGNWAAGVNNFNYSSAQTSEVEDWLTTPTLDFTGAVNPHLIFDHAYAGYSVSLYDSMAVWVSTDCGATWSRLASYDGSPGGNFETVPSQNSAFAPTASTDWCGALNACTDIDLAAYIGLTDVQFRWISKSGQGNNVYIDNINIGQALPAASIIASQPSACVFEGIDFSDGSGGAFLNYNWDFGPNGFPQTATGPGPHQVSFDAGGSMTVTLTADNGGASVNANYTVQIESQESAEFTIANPSVGTVDFNPITAQASADSLYWDFGDGNNSSAYSPQHTYASNGTYPVELMLWSSCGIDTYTLNVLIQGIGLEEWSKESFVLFPQPTSDVMNLQYTGTELRSDVEVRLIDAQGRIVRAVAASPSELGSGLSWSIQDLSAGWYQVQVQSETHFWQSPLIKQ